MSRFRGVFFIVLFGNPVGIGQSFISTFDGIPFTF